MSQPKCSAGNVYFCVPHSGRAGKRRKSCDTGARGAAPGTNVFVWTPGETGNEAKPPGEFVPNRPGAPETEEGLNEMCGGGDRRAVGSCPGSARGLRLPAGRSPEAPILVPCSRWRSGPFNCPVSPLLKTRQGAKGTYVIWAYFAVWGGHAARGFRPPAYGPSLLGSSLVFIIVLRLGG